jgi:hypothetical protein
MAVSDASWDGDASRFTIEQWRASCLVDTGQGDPDSKERYKLPVKEPGGALNRNGVHAAAGRVNQLQPASKRAAAARRIISLYRNELHEDPPDSLTGMGERSLHTPVVEHIYTPVGLEIRSVPGSKSPMTVGGYGVMFNARSDPRLGFRETFERSFFNKSEGDGWPGVLALLEHQPAIVLGAVHSGTLRLKQDGHGLDYEVDLPQSRSDVYESIERRDIQGSSVGFATYQEQWKPGDGGFPVRHLVSGRLDHVSPTAQPVYPSSTVALRSLAVQVEADYDEVYEDAEHNNLNRYFKRTDNIDKREKMDTPETRSAPTQEHTGVTINMYGGTVDAKPAESEARHDPVAEPEKPEPEEKPEVKAEDETKVESETKVEPDPQQMQPPPQPPEVKETEPEAKPEQKANPGELDLWERRNRWLENAAK